MDDFHGFATQRLSSRDLELDFLATAGPRIVRLRYKGSTNLLAEAPEIKVPTPFGDYRYLGGHRLWHAPESMPGSYMPDSSGLSLTEAGAGVILDGEREASTGIRKRVEIRPDHQQPRVQLVHTLFNEGSSVAEVAPWALTMLRLGGVAIIPLRTGRPPEPGLLPDRRLVIWPYSQIRDPRLRLEDDFALVSADHDLPPFKIGVLTPLGWIAYWLDGVLFRKSFEARPESLHPDFGCNTEVYCDSRFIELESLGALANLAPGQSTELRETWELFDSLEQPWLAERLIRELKTRPR